MKIVACYWDVPTNMLRILCDCGEKFDHRADRWFAKCPSCKEVEHLSELRNRWVDDHEANQMQS